MIVYELLTQCCDDGMSRPYYTYGIVVSDGGKQLRCIEDIALDRAKVAALIDSFNRDRLSPAHLDEAVENFLYDFEG